MPEKSVDWKARLKELGLGRKRREGVAAASTDPGAARRSRTGREGEDAAALLLASAGLTVLDRNWRTAGGELDLVVKDGRTVVFVEVKRRRSAAHGFSAEAVGPRKRERLLRAARAWLALNPSSASREVRFDVVAIDGEPPGVRWIKGAFDAS